MNQPPTSSLVLSGGSVLTGRDLEERRVNLVITDGVITAIDEPGAPENPDARTIDVSGLTLVPGFIDAHVHIGFYEPSDVLMGGVTTVRDLAWPPDRIFPLVEASRRAGFEGPEILAAGPMLTAARGYPTRAGWAPPGTGLELADVAEAQDAVDELADRGVNIIKVALNAAAGPTLPPEILDAIVERAHARGLKVTGHVTGLTELDKALDAGVDELAHMLKGAERIPDETLERMASQDMAVVPTLAPLEGLELEVALDNLRRFIAAGGRVVYGTDLGDAGPRPGIDPLEVQRMATAGMTPREIVASATTRSAGWLGLNDRGVIAVGMRGDVVGLPGASSAESLSDVRLVVRQGAVVTAP